MTALRVLLVTVVIVALMLVALVVRGQFRLWWFRRQQRKADQ